MPMARRHTTPAAKPMIMAPIVLTKPAQGVMATRPATAPEAAPRVVACPPLSRSTRIQLRRAAAAAMKVFMRAWAATPFAPRAEPALKPVHPNQRMPVPSRVSGSEWGGMAVFP